MRIGRVLLASIIGSGVLVAASSAPPNDLPENATPIEELPFTDEIDGAAATSTPDESPCGRMHDSDRTVWYRLHPDDALHVEFALARGTRSIDVVEADTCERPWSSLGEAQLEGDTEYLIRAADLADEATFAIREYTPPELGLEIDLIAQLGDDGIVVGTTTTCNLPIEVTLWLYGTQPNNNKNLLPAISQVMEPTVSCVDVVEEKFFLPRYEDSRSFTPGPGTVFWDVMGCVDVSWRYPGWTDCFHEDGDTTILILP